METLQPGPAERNAETCPPGVSNMEIIGACQSRFHGIRVETSLHSRLRWKAVNTDCFFKEALERRRKERNVRGPGEGDIGLLLKGKSPDHVDTRKEEPVPREGEDSGRRVMVEQDP